MNETPNFNLIPDLDVREKAKQIHALYTLNPVPKGPLYEATDVVFALIHAYEGDPSHTPELVVECTQLIVNFNQDAPSK